MNFNLLNQAALAVSKEGTFAPFSSDAWSFAGKMTLLGMLMIFAVLSSLWAVIALFKIVFAGKTPKAPKEPKASKVKEPKAKEKKEVVSAQNDEVIAAVIAAGVQAYREDDAALVAVLTAAIEEYRRANGVEGGFRVVSFKRVSAGRGWNIRK